MSRQSQPPTQDVPVIAIDGPSGSGKGTVSRLVADATGFALLDSGALYRLTALAAIKKSVDIADEQAVSAIAERLDIEFRAEAGRTRVLLDDADVTAAIRTEDVGLNASVVAALPKVRAALLERQRAFAQPPGLVADGRDMGTVVFPCAQLKVFLTASAEERARRRLEQLQRSGQEGAYGRILSDIQARDERDSTRASAPLRPADDAVLLDSTELTIDQVFDAVLKLAKVRFNLEEGR